MNKYIISLVNEKNVDVVFLKVENIAEDTLNQLQHEVGGYVDIANWVFPDFTDLGFDCWIAEDRTGKEPTLTRVDDGFNRTIYGNLVFARHDEEGNTIGLDPVECMFIAIELMKKAESAMPMELCLSSKEEVEKWELLIHAFERAMNTEVATA